MNAVDILSDRITVVLVEPKHGGNIGSVARAMKNTGLCKLTLVNPEPSFADEAARLAHGSREILGSARIVATLDEALAGIQVVVGTSAKTGRSRKKSLLPREFGEWVLGLDPLPQTAVLFGRENGGLMQSELQLCREMVCIPMVGKYPSINLSHAVMIILHELYSAFVLSGRKPPRATSNLADAAEVERMLRRMKEALRSIGFDRSGSDARMLRSIRRILEKRPLEPRDVRTAHKIMDYLSKRMGS